jgi:hypothetical protein
MRTAALALVTAMMVAGCTGADADIDGTDPSRDPASFVGLSAPTWQLGDHWTYSFSFGGQARFIVTGEEGTDWILDTDDKDFAFFHQAIEEVSTLGRVAKTDLSGTQGNDRVKYFDWPLQDGKTWSMTWDGETFQVTAHQQSETRFLMEAVQDGTVRRTYVYDDTVRWLRTVTFLDEDGNMAGEGTLQSSGRNHTGDYVRWDLPLDYRTTISMGEAFTDFFTVSEGVDEMWYDLALTCSPEGIEEDNGFLLLRAIPREAPTGGLDASGPCPFTRAEQGVLPPTPGDWTVNVLSGGASGHLRMVARTLETYSV